MRFILARIQGLFHIIIGHDLVWKLAADEVCDGDIFCGTCNQILWCRWYDPKWLGGKRFEDEGEEI